MHAAALRKVLLIRAIDEGDKAGEVLSHAERAEATQVAARDAPAIPRGLAGPSLPAPAERLLERRAELLMGKLEARAPVVGRVLDLAAGASWLGLACLAVACVCGVALSALDGSQRIDVLAFPLLGLIAWNFAVYVLLAVSRWKPRRVRPVGSTWLSSAYARWIRGRADALLRQTSRFNVPLAEAMQRFAADWSTVAQPLLLSRAKRLFHGCAAVLALGLIGGLYVRGLVLRYEAGWESTFLDAGQVSALLAVVYGPASALSGIPLPGAGELDALRWRGPAGGGPAAMWIHLIALTALLYIVVPRLALVVSESGALWRKARKPGLPPAFLPYARSLLLETGRVSGLRAQVTSYAFEPSRDSLAGLSVLLGAALGGEVKAELSNKVAYGEEDEFAARLRSSPLPAADCQVLLMSLSATPEAENHGALIEALQRAAPSFVLVIDESAYAARMGDDPQLRARVVERSRSWREFATARGQTACIVDLVRLRAGERPDDTAQKGVREALARATA